MAACGPTIVRLAYGFCHSHNSSELQIQNHNRGQGHHGAGLLMPMHLLLFKVTFQYQGRAAGQVEAELVVLIRAVGGQGEMVLLVVDSLVAAEGLVV